MIKNNKEKLKFSNFLRFTLILFITSQTHSQLVFDSTKISLTHLCGIKLEESKISDCFNRFGETKIYTSGDAGEYSKRFHYHFLKENSYVTFDITEMGGHTTVLVFIVNSEKPNEKFKTINDFEFNKDDVSGIRLGQTFKDVKVKLGKDVKTDKNKLTVSYWYKIPINEYKNHFTNTMNAPKGINECDLIVSFTGYFKNGKLNKFVCNRVTSF